MRKVFNGFAIFSAMLFSQSALAQESCSVLFVDTNISGGGFQSDVTITDDGLTVYSSADVSGISKSVDGGLRYESYNQGLESYKVASLAITPDNDQILYAGTGDKGNSGGLFRSVDGGKSWQRTADGAKAKFAGNQTARTDPLPKGHARSNGDLIVVDPGDNPETFSDDVVIVGSYKDGVRIFSQGGDVEIAAVNENGFVRSVAFNPSLPNTVFAAIQFRNDESSDDLSNKNLNGIYEIDYTDIDNPDSKLVYSANRPEGLAVLENGFVYAAISTEGIAKYNGRVWKLVNSGLSVDNKNRQWTAVTGYVSGGNVTVYAGVTNLGGNLDGENYSNIWRTRNGGRTWTALVNANENVSDIIYGQENEWWFRVGAFGQAGLGRKNSVVSSIDVARGPSERFAFDDIIYVSGRGGIWKSNDGGSLWQPAVNNMQVTANNGVAVNPKNPNQVVVANTDFVALETRSGYTGSNMSRDKPQGAESKAYDTIFDANANEIIIGVGARDTNDDGGGEVFIKRANDLGFPSISSWMNTELSEATASNNGRVRAVSYGYHDGVDKTSRTILAAVEGEGVYRFHDNMWSKSSGITIGATKRSNFVWPDNENSGLVYLLDLSSGLYRSNDGGRTWENMWPSMQFRKNDFYNTGYIAADDNDPTTLYLSIQGEQGSFIGAQFRVFRLTGADVGVFGTDSQPSTSTITNIARHSGNVPIKRPGPLKIGPQGDLWLTQQQDARNGIDAGIFVIENPRSENSFTALDSSRYLRTVVSPSGIDISRKGEIYITQNGLGLARVRPWCTGRSFNDKRVHFP